MKTQIENLMLNLNFKTFHHLFSPHIFFFFFTRFLQTLSILVNYLVRH